MVRITDKWCIFVKQSSYLCANVRKLEEKWSQECIKDVCGKYKIKLKH